jgi:signal transduction histidine kinase
MTKIFDPMFSTKPFGQKTGLGLTLVHDIIYAEFGGTIDEASTPGAGTVFSIILPQPD